MFRSMQSKILVAIMATTGVAVLLATIIYYWKSADMIEKNYGENLYARICQLGDSFDESLKDIYYLTAQVSCEETFEMTAEKYWQKEDGSEENLVSMMRDYCSRCSELESIYLLYPEEGVVVTSRDYPVIWRKIDEKTKNQIAQLSGNTMTPHMIQDPIKETSDILSFVSPILDDAGVCIAYLMCNVDERTIYYKYLDSLEEEGAKAMILNEANSIVSIKNQSRIGTAYEENSFSKISKDGVQVYESENMVGITYRTSFSGYYFHMETELGKVLSDLKDIRYFLIAILLAETVAAFGVAAFITKKMNQPLKELTKTMEEVGEGNLWKRVKVTGADEIGVLSRDFNQMLNHIQELVDQLVREETLKKNAELEALQYQITPHFMYNTLNSIKYLALLKGEDETGKYMDDFVELLQASINKKGTFVTIAEEIHFLRNYINLQNMRYEDNLETCYEIEEDAQGCFVPRLILQPLVENAILYGFDRKKENFRIMIAIKRSQDQLYLSVQDNGRGMSEKQIEILLKTEKNKEHGLSGIGVANVKERLRLYYGEKGSLNFKSGEEGTTALICLPASKEQSQYEIR